MLDLHSNENAPLKVSQLVAILKKDVETKHKAVRVLGEISSFKQWRSGHCYFDLKDEEALLPAVMFKPFFQRLPFNVKEGMLMVCSGRLSIYPANTRLQMLVESMEPVGDGALALAFAQLKERLEKEGLFKLEHKKTLKNFNQTIGIVTSSHGAAIRDMVKIFKARAPGINLVFAFTKVQGVGAKEEIAEAIKLLDNYGECDAIIVGRGGGSLEDLWAFNEELVARAIFAAKTPIVSAVGHESDHSISDLVADARAATPTHAASMLSPAVEELLQSLARYNFELNARQKNHWQKHKLQVLELTKALKDPKAFLHGHWQKLDEQSVRLKALAPYRLLSLKKAFLAQENIRLKTLCPSNKIKSLRQDLKYSAQHLQAELKKHVFETRAELKELVATLETLSPLKVLTRGYAVAIDRQGNCVKNTSQIKPGDELSLRFNEGQALAQIKEILC